MRPKDAVGIANSVDPDQTAPLGAVWSGITLFAQAYLSKNVGSLRYPFGWFVALRFCRPVKVMLSMIHTVPGKASY